MAGLDPATHAAPHHWPMSGGIALSRRHQRLTNGVGGRIKSGHDGIIVGRWATDLIPTAENIDRSNRTSSWSAQADHPRLYRCTKESRGSSAFAEDDGGES